MKDSLRLAMETAKLGEPLFSVRGRDLHAVSTIDFYIAEYRRRTPKPDPEFVADLEGLRELFVQWRDSHLLLLKYPD